MAGGLDIRTSQGPSVWVHRQAPWQRYPESAEQAMEYLLCAQTARARVRELHSDDETSPPETFLDQKGVC